MATKNAQKCFETFENCAKHVFRPQEQHSSSVTD